MKFLVVAIALLTVNTVYAQDKMMKDGDKMMKDEVTVIQLSQTPGEYETKSLALTPGKYIFEVTNSNVSKKLGFYLTDDTKTQVANSGLKKLIKKGETAKTGIVELKAGNYNYSCPLNPTPHYALTVADKMMKEDKMGDHKMMKEDKMMEGEKMAKDKMSDAKMMKEDKMMEGEKMAKDKMGDHKMMKEDKMMKSNH